MAEIANGRFTSLAQGCLQSTLLSLGVGPPISRAKQRCSPEVLVKPRAGCDVHWWQKYRLYGLPWLCSLCHHSHASEGLPSQFSVFGLNQESYVAT